MSVNQQNIVKSINGDKVIMFADSTKVKKHGGMYSMPTISQWYNEDPENNHLGLQSMFGQIGMQAYSYGILPDLLQNKKVLTVGASNTFTYDIPVEEDYECMTVRDHSDQAFAGLDDGSFKISLSEQFEPGDVLTVDPLYGDQIIVTNEEPVINLGDSYEHIVKLVTNDKEDYYSASLLAPGISYTKISQSLGGEFDVDYWSTVQMPNTSGYYRCEFFLGNETGVEAVVTGAADRAFSGAKLATSQTKDYMSKLYDYAEKHGDLAMLMDYDMKTGKADPKSMRLSSTVELLVRKELEKLLNHQIMFQRAGRVQGTNGASMLNEGMWHQMRRGKLIKYARPMGMTKAHIKEAVEYVFRGNPLQPYERRITFECGTEMEKNFLEIFRDEVNQQLSNENGFNPVIFGTDGQLPKSPISGELDSLVKKRVAFRTVDLPGIGMVTLKVNTNLDYVMDVDRFQMGFHPYQKNHTTYSAVIWDAQDQSFSNNKTVPEGTKLIEGGNDSANMYLVKRQGDLVTYGSENGRYDPMSSSNILSSSRSRSITHWAYGSIAGFIPDPSRFVMIELDPAGRKGYM